MHLPHDPTIPKPFGSDNNVLLFGTSKRLCVSPSHFLQVSWIATPHLITQKKDLCFEPFRANFRCVKSMPCLFGTKQIVIAQRVALQGGNCIKYHSWILASRAVSVEESTVIS